MTSKDENNILPVSRNLLDQSGVTGFASNLGGHAKANHSNTSSFGNDVPTQVPEEKHPEPAKKESGKNEGRQRLK